MPLKARVDPSPKIQAPGGGGQDVKKMKFPAASLKLTKAEQKPEKKGLSRAVGISNEALEVLY